MIDVNLVNFAHFLTSELRAMCIKGKQLYQTGNMQRSIVSITINDNKVDIVIATDYASYTNTRGRMAGWVEKTIQRAARAYSSNNDVDDEWVNGIIATIVYQ